VKKISYKILLIAAGLIMLSGISTSVFSQGVLCLDTAEFKEIELIIAEDSVLRANNQELQFQVDGLTRNDSLCDANKIKYDNSILSLNEIIKMQAGEIRRFESTPMQVIEEGWKWWHKILAVLGGAAFGYAACEIIQLTK